MSRMITTALSQLYNFCAVHAPEEISIPRQAYPNRRVYEPNQALGLPLNTAKCGGTGSLHRIVAVRLSPSTPLRGR